MFLLTIFSPPDNPASNDCLKMMNQNREDLDDVVVERWCKDQINDGSDFLFDRILFQEAMKIASQRFDFPLESLQSLFRNLYVKHVKSTSHRLKNSLHTKFIKEYLSGRSIIALAKESNLPPALLARRLVEEMTILGKKKLNTILKNPLEELGTIDVIKIKYQEPGNYQKNRMWVVWFFIVFSSNDANAILLTRRFVQILKF